MNPRYISVLLPFVLAAPARAGVVTILTDRDQTLFESSIGCCSSGAGVYLYVGDLANGNINRGLVHFDVAGQVPAGSTIVSVRLDLNLSRSRVGAENMLLHRVLQDWGEAGSDSGSAGQTMSGLGAPAQAGDATWQHTSLPNAFWNNPGGDFVLQPSATVLMEGAAGIGTQSFESAGMVDDVQAWLDDPASNFGWMIRAEDEFVARSARRFDSRESGDPSITPRIEVHYTGPVGASYCVGAANSAGGGASISALGCTVAAQQSLTLRAEGLPARVPGLFYYSPTQVQNPFGDGFLCVGGVTSRIFPPTFADAAGVAQREIDFTLPSAGGIVSGADLNFQHWYRDPAAGMSGHNATDGLNIVFQ